MEHRQGGNARCGHRLLVVTRRHCCSREIFSPVRLKHHERRCWPTSDHPQDQEEKERRAGRRTRLLRLEEKEEGARYLPLCSDSRTREFLEHKGL
jgi:hypothetical protein